MLGIHNSELLLLNNRYFNFNVTPLQRRQPNQTKPNLLFWNSRYNHSVRRTQTHSERVHTDGTLTLNEMSETGEKGMSAEQQYM